MDEMEKEEALRRAKEMFNTFDIDNEKHSGIIVMYDKESNNFKMLTINANPETVIMLLSTAYDTALENMENIMPDRTLN